jgi:hypothetical protein
VVLPVRLGGVLAAPRREPRSHNLHRRSSLGRGGCQGKKALVGDSNDATPIGQDMKGHAPPMRSGLFRVCFPDPRLAKGLANALALEAAAQANRLRTRADARTRTGDPFITSEVLYQLSYVGEASTLAASDSNPDPRTGCVKRLR